MLSNLVKFKDYNVMIVEDDIIQALGLEVKLQNIGLYVSSLAATPEQAINHAIHNRPDIAIIDINLNSEKTGIDVAKYFWKNFNIPIIYLTSYYNDRTVNKAMESEPYAYLIKPYRDEELKVAINTVLHKHQFFFKNKEALLSKKPQYISIKKGLKYDLANSELFYNENIIKLTKNEKKFIEILLREIGRVVSFKMIYSYIWREDVCDLAKLRTLIYRLKIKLGCNPFINLHNEGYKIKVLKDD